MKEKDIYKRMKIRLLGKHIFLHRFEAYSIPDVHYVKSVSSSGWIELKVINKFPKKDYITIPFRKGQYAWIRKYIKFSEYIFLFIYIEHTLFVIKGMNIHPAYTKTSIRSSSCYHQLWDCVNWHEVFNLL